MVQSWIRMPSPKLSNPSLKRWSMGWPIAHHMGQARTPKLLSESLRGYIFRQGRFRKGGLWNCRHDLHHERQVLNVKLGLEGWHTSRYRGRFRGQLSPTAAMQSKWVIHFHPGIFLAWIMIKGYGPPVVSSDLARGGKPFIFSNNHHTMFLTLVASKGCCWQHDHEVCRPVAKGAWWPEGPYRNTATL